MNLLSLVRVSMRSNFVHITAMVWLRVTVSSAAVVSRSRG